MKLQHAAEILNIYNVMMKASEPLARHERNESEQVKHAMSYGLTL